MRDRGPGVWGSDMESESWQTKILGPCKGRELDHGKSGYLMVPELGEGEWLVMWIPRGGEE